MDIIGPIFRGRYSVISQHDTIFSIFYPEGHLFNQRKQLGETTSIGCFIPMGTDPFHSVGHLLTRKLDIYNLTLQL